MFGAGALSYIEKKAIEMTTKMWDRPELEEVKSLLHGKAHEYDGFCEYVKVTCNSGMQYFGEENPIFYPYEPFAEEAGGSPDCAFISITADGDGKIDVGAEIKCPKDPAIHSKRLEWKDQYDIRENYILAYTQMQTLLMCTGAFEWHFVSYDPRQIFKRDRVKIIAVKPDKNFQNNLEIRLKQAIRDKYKLISMRHRIQVTNRDEFNAAVILAA